MISVVICTYNPKLAYLNRAIDAVLNQDLSPGEWEFVVVDNNSSPPISGRSVARSGEFRIVTEPRQGLSAARERGVNSTRGDILVFFDDDNVPHRGYLSAVRELLSDD